LECLRQERRRHEQRQHEADCDRRDARAAGGEIKSRAEDALEHLPASWAERIRPDATLSVTKCFAAPFPDAAELERLRGQCAGQRDSEAQLRQIQEQIAQRDALRARREPSAARQSTLEAAYPPSQAAALRARAQEAEAQSRDAESAAQALLEPLDAARAAEHEALNAAQEAREQMATAQAAIQAESARCEQIEHGLQTRIAELPAAWQNAIKPLDDDALNAQISLWRGEAGALNGAVQRLDDLRAAQSQHEARVERQRNLTAALEAVPEEARRAPAELRAQEAEAKERAEAAAAQERVLRSEQQSRAETRQRRAELEESYHRAAHGAQLHKILAELLGRDKLQRFLLQQAEAGIVSNANQVLDRISGGALRLELRRHQENEEESPRRARSAPKALDLIAINTATGEKPLPVYLLSGSQRFRVAVSLALGIGQFASQSARRIESVIIDEGFGGLDQEGRREIIDELHHLKTELKRIILVSHQEEFADAFPNRYSIALKNGTSTASLVDGS